ncbi:MAG: hypothetical protein HC851_15400 [Acaryochloris sp. RU_4_1]|nr:hypothetical protein [Acaryochloris sp. RU_4_1]NJR57270.1 hypothetical protein [Acaryochloris sp. CRU_2_0]
MTSDLKTMLIFSAIGIYVVLLGFRKEFRANTITIFLAAVVIMALISAPLGLQYLRHWIEGVPLKLELNYFWGLIAYWLGLKLCDSKLPGFQVDWSSYMRCSICIFAFYYFLALSFGIHKVLFMFLCWPALVCTPLFLLIPWLPDPPVIYLDDGDWF